MNSLVASRRDFMANACQFSQIPSLCHTALPPAVDDAKEYHLRTIQKSSDGLAARKIVTKGKSDAWTWKQSVGDKTFAKPSIGIAMRWRKPGSYRRKMVPETQKQATPTKAGPAGSEPDVLAKLFTIGFLENIYAIAPQDLQSATDRVFDTVDRLLSNGRDEVCDDILAGLDVSRLPTALLRSFLTITAPAKARLSARPAFFSKAFAEVTKQRGQEMAQRLLGRLA